MTDDSLLAVDDLHTGYNETKTLHGVSLSIDRGEVVSLIGRNGAGKTTTLRAITGALPIWQGTVTYDGQALEGVEPTTIAELGIALVPEERRVFPGLTVEENLRIGTLGGTDGESDWTVEDVFDMFDALDDRRTNQGAQLSGGEQQMLAIARALVSGPDLLLLDEPTEGLAPIIVERVEDIVADLNERGLTVLLVEQNVETALALADRHYIIDRGEVVFTGPTERLESDREVLDRHLGVSY